MGTRLLGNQLEHLKTHCIDKLHLEKLISGIKCAEDIEVAIKQYLSIMSVKEKVGQLQQLSYS
jgi:hypothetical protein